MTLLEQVQGAVPAWHESAPPTGLSRDDRPRRASQKYGKGTSNQFAEMLDMALPVLMDALSDHQWHRMELVHAVAQDFRIGFRALIDNACVAVSDSGAWVARVDDSTPEFAPDEMPA